MPQVLLVNPSTRKGAKKPARKAVKGKATMAKKTRTAAQKRATAKLVAMNKARRSGKSVSHAKPARRRTRKVTRRSNPIVETALMNPSKRRKVRRSTKAASSSAGRVLRYRRKRNPVGGIGEFVTGQLMPSAIGGGGALLLDVALAVLPIPATLKVGAMAPVVRIAGAVGIGALAGMVTNRKTANQIAAGALTVTMYQIARGFLAKALPAGSVPGLSAPPAFYDPALPGGMGEYVGDPMMLPDGTGMGEYVNGADDLGYINSGVMVGDPDGVGDYEDVSGYETGVYR